MSSSGSAGPVPAGDQDQDPVDASTVILLRDRPAATRSRLQVLMLERHVDSDVLGGALVFPGGKVDAADRELDAARWIGPPMATWRDRLGVPTTADALGLLCAAVRECFEEAGVLLASREDGTPLTVDDLSRPSFVEARRRLNERDGHWDWRPWLSDEGITLSFDALALWSWWLTPTGPHRRFDTRFFAAVLPPGQVARHDEVETTSLRWTHPQDALRDHEEGRATVIFPTRRNLQALLTHRSAGAAWQAARAWQDDVQRIEPRIITVEGRALVQHPDGGTAEPV